MSLETQGVPLEAEIALVELTIVERSPAMLYLFALGSTNKDNVCICLQRPRRVNQPRQWCQ